MDDIKILIQFIEETLLSGVPVALSTSVLIIAFFGLMENYFSYNSASDFFKIEIKKGRLKKTVKVNSNTENIEVQKMINEGILSITNSNNKTQDVTIRVIH